MIVLKEVRKVDGMYYVYSSKGKKLSKGFRSKSEARRRLQQVEYFKTHKEDGHPFMNDLNEEQD